MRIIIVTTTQIGRLPDVNICSFCLIVSLHPLKSADYNLFKNVTIIYLLFSYYFMTSSVSKKICKYKNQYLVHANKHTNNRLQYYLFPSLLLILNKKKSRNSVMYCRLCLKILPMLSSQLGLRKLLKVEEQTGRMSVLKTRQLQLQHYKFFWKFKTFQQSWMSNSVYFFYNCIM